MKAIHFVIITSLFYVTPSFAKPVDINRVSYSIGYMMGSNAHYSAKDINQDEFVKGIKDGIAGKQSAISDSQMERLIKDYQQQQNQILLSKNRQNSQQEKLFLAENSKKAGIISTSSGLQYQILKPGRGKKPDANDTVTVKYTGKLLDGRVFDSTQLHGGKPTRFSLNSVIDGWVEGLQLMPEGSQYRFFIPARLAYGE